MRGRIVIDAAIPRRTRFPGICADAKALGVCRITLYRVLRGEYPQLKTLRARYALLKQTQNAQ